MNMKNLFLISVALLFPLSCLVAQKHITFDASGEILKNDFVKVDTLLLINEEKGAISDTVFVVSLENKTVFFVSKTGKTDYSFFPYMNMQIQPIQKETVTEIIVFDKTAFLFFGIAFSLLFVFFLVRNQKYMRKLQTAVFTINEYSKTLDSLIKSVEGVNDKVNNTNKAVAQIQESVNSKILPGIEDAKSIKKTVTRIEESVNLKILPKLYVSSGMLSENEIYLLNLPLSNFPFHTRVLSVFKNNDLVTVLDLLKMILGKEKKIFLTLRNLGAGSIAVIEEVLIENGFIYPFEENRDKTAVYTSKYDEYLSELIK